MAKVIIRGQTVSVAKIEDRPLKDPSRKGETLKIAYFTVADRDRHAVKDSKGSIVYETDGFYFCKAIGNNAKIIEDRFSKKDASGKLISRKIYLECDMKQYKDTKKQLVSMPVPAKTLLNALKIDSSNIQDTTVSLEKTEEFGFDAYIFEVKELRMEDYIDPDDKAAETKANTEVRISIGSPVTSTTSYEPTVSPSVTAPVEQPRVKPIEPSPMPEAFNEELFNDEGFENPFP